ncbi:transglutaminase domain-containing protein [Saccharopolyspora erythraea]|uniref:transglutaminase family protein n=1 Tax=Saccharopolyspora erythraea TaxID=1836 RepID=UPI001BAB059A|nr:transglutaminase domain-containing protein [Saccharopolyspora erythraea]QUH03930.1 transglutaminase domain-containing protein [Saccharopolyspora erythraea]
MTRVGFLPTACVVLAAVVAGLLFAPVFGVAPLILPLVVPAMAALAVTVLGSRRQAVVPWRPVLALLAGLLAIVETLLLPTTVAGIPTGETVRALATGATESWRLALQSTWPARPEPALMLFVPLLVLLACVLGVELLHRWGALPSLVPSFAVVVLSQCYSATTGSAAALAAVAYAGAAGTLLAATRADQATDERRRMSALLLTAPAVALTVVAAIVGALLPASEARYTLKDDQFAPLADSSMTSPLDELADRLTHPDTPVFTVDGSADVDRWPVVVLNDFDGVNWTPGSRYRRLGASLRPGPEVAVDVERRTAEIGRAELGGPWLPSQPLPAGVDGIDPLVEERQGSLLAPQASGPVRYTLSWWEPQVAGFALDGAAVDRSPAEELGGVGQVPPGVAELADRAVPVRPTFQSAVALERFLRDEYRLATGQNLPTGHSWPQLEEFLLKSKRGTSEQFAAAYVALARIKGIPARLVVGFRAPPDREPGGGYTVRNGDALAWPEVAVEGVGWVPLDPSGTAAAQSPGPARGLAAAAEAVRAELPPPDQLRDAPVAPAPVASSSDTAGGWSFPFWALLAVPLPVVPLWVAGVPLAKALRAWRRRRRPGVGAVIGAWEEARDRLRAYGVPVSAGMTVRDLTTAVAATDGATVDGLRSLGATVDFALWSGAGPASDSGRHAWAAVRAVRRGLGRRGLRARLRAALNPAPLRAPR